MKCDKCGSDDISFLAVTGYTLAKTEIYEYECKCGNRITKEVEMN